MTDDGEQTSDDRKQMADISEFGRGMSECGIVNEEGGIGRGQKIDVR